MLKDECLLSKALSCVSDIMQHTNRELLKAIEQTTTGLRVVDPVKFQSYLNRHSAELANPLASQVHSLRLAKNNANCTNTSQ